MIGAEHFVKWANKYFHINKAFSKNNIVKIGKHFNELNDDIGLTSMQLI